MKYSILNLLGRLNHHKNEAILLFHQVSKNGKLPQCFRQSSTQTKNVWKFICVNVQMESCL